MIDAHKHLAVRRNMNTIPHIKYDTPYVHLGVLYPIATMTREEDVALMQGSERAR